MAILARHRELNIYRFIPNPNDPFEKLKLPKGLSLKKAEYKRILKTPRPVIFFTPKDATIKKLVCPCCGERVIRFGHYIRLIWLDTDLVYAVISVVQCTNDECPGKEIHKRDNQTSGKVNPTHAVLPESCVPYMQISAEIIEIAAKLIIACEQKSFNGFDLSKYLKFFEYDQELSKLLAQLKAKWDNWRELLARALFSELRTKLTAYYRAIKSTISKYSDLACNFKNARKKPIPNGYGRHYQPSASLVNCKFTHVLSVLLNEFGARFSNIRFWRMHVFWRSISPYADIITYGGKNGP